MHIKAYTLIYCTKYQFELQDTISISLLEASKTFCVLVAPKRIFRISLTERVFCQLGLSLGRLKALRMLLVLYSAVQSALKFNSKVTELLRIVEKSSRGESGD